MIIYLLFITYNNAINVCLDKKIRGNSSLNSHEDAAATNVKGSRIGIFFMKFKFKKKVCIFLIYFNPFQKSLLIGLIFLSRSFLSEISKTIRKSVLPDVCQRSFALHVFEYYKYYVRRSYPGTSVRICSIPL